MEREHVVIQSPFVKCEERGRESFLVFGSPAIGQAEIDEVVDSLRSGWLGTGPKTARFEREFARYKGSANATAVNSCTAALHLSLVAAGIGAGDEVITTPLTFCATVNAIIHAGATPVLADVDERTMNIDPAAIAAAITQRTAAIVPVHFAGRACEMDEVCAIARRHGLCVIEDCAHAIETEYQGRGAGTFGEFGCFSFYVTKNICTGEGGMVLAKRAEDADRVRTLALHGMTRDAWKRFSASGYKHYSVIEAGFKYNMMDVQAALGIHQLARVEENWLRRREVWRMYQDAFAGIAVTRPMEPALNTRHAYHLYTLLIDEAACGARRDDMLDAMTQRKIGVGVHYVSVAEHPFYQQTFGWRPEQWPHAMHIGRRTMSLPISAKLTNTDVADVIDAVQGALADAAASGSALRKAA